MHGSSTDESDLDFTIGVDTDSSDQSDDSKAPVVLSLRFEQFTRECDVKFYTGLPSTAIFKCLFDFLAQKAQRMQYWRGAKQTEKVDSKSRKHCQAVSRDCTQRYDAS